MNQIHYPSPSIFLMSWIKICPPFCSDMYFFLFLTTIKWFAHVPLKAFPFLYELCYVRSNSNTNLRVYLRARYFSSYWRSYFKTIEKKPASTAWEKLSQGKRKQTLLSGSRKCFNFHLERCLLHLYFATKPRPVVVDYSFSFFLPPQTVGASRDFGKTNNRR